MVAILTNVSPPDSSRRPRRRRRWGRIVLASGLAVLLVLGVLVALAPMIAGKLAPGLAERGINAAIHGRVTIGKVSLSWFGEQRIGPIEVVDAGGTNIARLNIESSRGLLGIFGGAVGLSSLDLGTTTLTGSATVVRKADGNLQLLDLLKPSASPRPSPSPSPAPTNLPMRLAARFVVDRLDVTFIDEQQVAAGSPAAVIRIAELSGEASLQPSMRIGAALSGTLTHGPSPSAASLPGGSFQFTVQVDDVADAGGRPTPDRATCTLSLDITDIQVAAIDALTGMEGALATAIGDTVTIAARVDGSPSSGRASFTTRSQGMEADIRLETTDGILRTSQPGRITVHDGSLLHLAPGVLEALAASADFTLTELPDATLTIDNLRLPLPLGGKPLDLRSASFNVDLRTSEIAGLVRIPQPDVAPGPAREYRMDGVLASIASHDLADRIMMQTQVHAMLDGRSAGYLHVDLAAIDPLDAQGKPRPWLARDVQGVASLTGLATIIAQPFVEALGINLATDLGPELDIVLRANAVALRPPAAPESTLAAIPSTLLAMDVRAANVTGAADLLLDSGTLTATERGIEFRLVSLADLLTRRFGEQGLTVERGAGATLNLSRFHIDLPKLLAGSTGAPGSEVHRTGPDLRAVSGVLRVETTAASGRLTLPDQPMRQWELAPMVTAVDAAAIQRGIHVQSAARARMDGQSAGVLDVDVHITDLLDEHGQVTAGLPAIDGRIALSEMATAILQPMVMDLGLDVVRGIGPRLDVTLVAATESTQESSQAGAVPRSTVDLTIASARVNGNVPLLFDGPSLRTRGDGAVLSVSSPGMLAGPAAISAGLSMTEEGFLRLSARRVALSLQSDQSPLLARAAGEFEIAFGGFSMRPLPTGPSTGAPPEPLALNQMFLTLRLDEGKPAVLASRGSGMHQQEQFFTQGTLELAGLETGADLALVRPLGQVEVRNLPTSLLAMAIPADPAAALDPAALVKDLVGPRMTVNLDSARSPEGASMDRRITFTARSPRLTSQLAADISETALSVRQATVAAQVAPELATRLIGTFAEGQLASPPRIAQPARLSASLQPVSIPLNGGMMPDFARAGIATLTANLEGQWLAGNIVLAATPERPQRSIGMLGLQNVAARVEYPLAALAPGAAPARTRYTLNGAVLGAADRTMVEIRSEGDAMLADGMPVGTMNASAVLAITDTWRVDQIMGQDGMLAQAVGQTLNVDAALAVDFPAAGAAGQGGSGGLAFSRAALRAVLTAPRLTTPRPLRVVLLPDRMMLEGPAELQWQMHHEWANRFLLGAVPGAPAAPHETRFVQPTPIRVALSTLTLARGEDVGPLRHGVFSALVDVTSTGTEVLTAGTPARFSGLNLRIVGGREAGAIGFNLRLQDAGGGPGPQGEFAVQFAGGIYGVADAAGRPTLATSQLTVEGAARRVPTSIVDALAQQGGFLVDAMGSTVSLDLRARGVSEAGGAVTATVTSDRGRAEVSGTIQGMVFTADGPAQASLNIITPQFGQRLSRGLPLVGHFEKTPAEEPAVITMTDLIVPLDGNLRRLNGRITFDPGEARFGISRPFAPLLRIVDQPVEAIVGRRLQPISLRVTNGVIAYDRFNVPIGQFTFAMQGSVDLAERRLDVITFVPFGAVTEEVAGNLRTGLGSLLGIVSPTLDSLTMVPFRVRGEFGRFSVQPDLPLMVQELQRQLLRPDRILGGTARDLIDLLTPRRSETPQQSEPPPQPPR